MNSMDMDLQGEVISGLLEFGLEKTDALLYLGLLQTGTASVNTVSSKSGIEKGKIYRSLHKLQNLGLISSTFSNPAMLTALSPEKALKTIIQRREEEITSMHKVLKKLAENIKQFEKPTEEVSQIPSFYVIQGRPNIYSRIGQLIESSTNVTYVVTTVDDLTRMSYTAVPDKIRSCTREGGKVMVIVNAGVDDNAAKLEDIGATEIRIGSLSRSRMVVSENNRLMMSGFVNKSTSLNDDVDSALYTNSKEIVNNIYDYCTHLWSISTPMNLKSRNLGAKK